MGLQALTGIVLFFDLFVLRSRLFEFISEVHRYNGLVLVFIVLTHLYLNWGWVKNQFLSGLTRK
jgi:cytochrome b subunit of formate dehydrogenase